MGDITIKAKALKRETWVFLGVFLFSVGLNIFSILHYKTSWSELYTHLHVVLLISILCYVLMAGLRVLFKLGAKLLREKASHERVITAQSSRRGGGA